ncbi:MAG: anthranilate phosphoribosyltransferase, partial [Bacteroidota bacterium]
LNGYDEMSLTGPVKVNASSGEFQLLPKDLGLRVLAPEQLFGGKTVPEAAQIFKSILEGEGTPEQEEVVIANASLAIQTARPQATLAEAVEMARFSLKGGKALVAFKLFLN